MPQENREPETHENSFQSQNKARINELFDKFDSLSEPAQTVFSNFVDTLISKVEQIEHEHKEELSYKNLPKKLSFFLKLDIEHRLSKLSHYDKSREIALSSAFHAEAIFYLLNQINERVEFSSDNIDKDELMLHSAFICEIGKALAANAASYISEMDLQVSMEVIKNDR